MIKAVISNAGYQWIWVGEVTVELGWVKVGRAVNIRRYADGITSLHSAPDKCTIDAAFSGVEFAIGAAIQIHDVDQDKWSKILDKHHD